MDENGYGRYVDENDGMPRWKLPQVAHPKGLRWKYIREAITELYPEHGGRFVAERLGMPSKYVNVMRYAAMFGVRTTRERRKKGYEEMARKLRGIYKMERARLLRGLPRVTKVNIGQKGYARTPQGFYALRNRFVTVYRYYYCEGDASTLLYDDRTKRRVPGRIPPNGFTEDEVTRRYGITFERVEDEEDEASPAGTSDDE